MLMYRVHIWFVYSLDQALSDDINGYVLVTLTLSLDPSWPWTETRFFINTFLFKDIRLCRNFSVMSVICMWNFNFSFCLIMLFIYICGQLYMWLVIFCLTILESDLDPYDDNFQSQILAKNCQVSVCSACCRSSVHQVILTDLCKDWVTIIKFAFCMNLCCQVA